MAGSATDVMTPAHCRAARGWLGWSQSDLAVTSGVSMSVIAKFERNHTEPHQFRRDALTAAFQSAGVRFAPTGVLYYSGLGIPEESIRRLAEKSAEIHRQRT